MKKRKKLISKTKKKSSASLTEAFNKAKIYKPARKIDLAPWEDPRGQGRAPDLLYDDDDFIPMSFYKDGEPTPSQLQQLRDKVASLQICLNKLAKLLERELKRF